MSDLNNNPRVRIAASHALQPVLVLALMLTLTASPGCQNVESRLNTYRATKHIDRGQEFLEKDDLEAARIAFEQAVRLDSQMAEAHSALGDIYRRMGEISKAITAYGNAVSANPYSFSDTFSLAQLYHYSKRLRDAVEVYLAAVDLRPDDYNAQLSLGVCYQQLSEPTMAVERFNKAIDVDPDRAHAYVNLGVALESQGKHYEAISAYKASLERDNHQPLVLVNLANTFMKQGRLKIARATLEQGIMMDPTLAAAHEAKGYCLFRMKLYDEAATAYQDALSLDNRLAKAHAGLGAINMLEFAQDDTKLAMRDSALEHWHRSLEIDPNQTRIRNLLQKYAPSNNSADPYKALLGNDPDENR